LISCPVEVFKHLPPHATVEQRGYKIRCGYLAHLVKVDKVVEEKQEAARKKICTNLAVYNVFPTLSYLPNKM
jgi:hypothetical protein